MTDALYTRAAATSARLLAKYGQPITLRRVSAGTYDANTGVAVPGQTDITRNGALLDFGAGQTEERGNLIQAFDKRLLLEPGTPPTLKDRVVISSSAAQYTIVSIGEVNPGGTAALYDIHLRR